MKSTCIVLHVHVHVIDIHVHVQELYLLFTRIYMSDQTDTGKEYIYM